MGAIVPTLGYAPGRGWEAGMIWHDIAVMTYGYMMGAVFAEKPLVPRWVLVVGAVVSYLFAATVPA